MKISPVDNKPGFKGSFVKFGKDWMDEAKKAINPEQVKSTYDSAGTKNAMNLDSDKMRVYYPFAVETNMKDLSVVLTDKDAENFQKAEGNKKELSFFNKLFRDKFDGIFEFDDIKVKKQDNLNLMA